MPNPVPAKYTVQLGPTVTPETAGELAAWAQLLGKSTSEVTRECVEHGLDALRRDFEIGAQARLELTTVAALRARFREALPQHIAAARERGERQVSRRRNYDERTRKGDSATAERAEEGGDTADGAAA